MGVQLELPPPFGKAETPVSDFDLCTPPDVRLLMDTTFAPVHELEERLRAVTGKEYHPFETNIRINNSQIEVVYPWILNKLGYDVSVEETNWRFDEARTASTIGTKLHMAYTLFGAVDQLGAGLRLQDMFPSAKPSDLDSYAHALANVPRRRITSEDEYRETLFDVWDRFHSMREFVKAGTIPLQLGLGLRDPAKVARVWHGEQMYERGRLLAETFSWQRSHWDPRLWMYHRGVRTYYEMTVIANWNCGIQSIARLDSLTVKQSEKDETVTVGQALDLKTGAEVDFDDPLFAEIRMRQSQHSERITQWAVSGLFYTPHIASRGKGYPLPGKRQDHTAPYVNKNTEFNFITLGNGNWFDMDRVGAAGGAGGNFNRWFTWLGQAAQAYEGEVRALLSQQRKASKAG